MLDHHPVTDDKRTEQIKILVSERMELDLHRAAAMADRAVADWIYQTLRKALYGEIAVLDRAVQRASRDS